MTQRKPQGYWKNWENVERELIQVIEELGHFPTGTELQERGQTSLGVVISKCYGGFRVVRKKLGYAQIVKPNGYWQQIENVENELATITERIGYFPRYKELHDLGRSDLANAVKYHGGYPAVRKKMGFSHNYKPRGYWQKWDNFEGEMRGVIRKLKHFPTQQELYKLGRNDLVAAVRHYGGLNKIEQRLGFTARTKPKKYWKLWENVKQTIEEVVDQLGYFPVFKELTTLAGSGLTSGIYEYHGGLPAVREKMGYDPVRKEKGYWESWENVAVELGVAMQALSHFPTHQELQDINMSGLSFAITKYYGGIKAVKERLRQEGSIPLEKERLEQLLETYIKQ